MTAPFSSTKSKRAKAKRVSIFNHKGGVGKTTLTFNIAAALTVLGKRVLVVDTDPQCNLTAYVIDGEVLDDLLDNSDGLKGQTVWSAVKPIVDATGPVKAVKPIELDNGLWLLPGDIRLSDFENDLNDFWRECFQRKKRGLQGTAALSFLVNTVCDDLDLDYVFFDSGPNVGPLNRSIILDCDFFIIPVAYDLFSIRALTTLGRAIFSWLTDWQTISQLAPDEIYLPPGKPKYLGYIPQKFSIYGGVVASHQRKYSGPLERGIRSEIVSVLKPFGPGPGDKAGKLGEVKDFGQLVSASQMQGLPMSAVKMGDQNQRKAAEAAFHMIAQRIIKLTD